MNRTDFIQSSGFAVVCTRRGTHHKPAPARRQRGRALIRSVLLACAMGASLAAWLFFGASQ